MEGESVLFIKAEKKGEARESVLFPRWIIWPSGLAWKRRSVSPI
jgi:hypothetical protein